VHCPGKDTKNASFSIFRARYQQMLALSSKSRDQEGYLRTLNDLQKLLGEIIWLRPSLKLTTDTLSIPFQLLKGDPNPFSLRELMEDARQALVKVESAITTAQLQRWDPQ
jgi:hypothetical protein